MKQRLRSNERKQKKSWTTARCALLAIRVQRDATLKYWHAYIQSFSYDLATHKNYHIRTIVRAATNTIDTDFNALKLAVDQTFFKIQHIKGSHIKTLTHIIRKTYWPWKTPYLTPPKNRLTLTDIISDYPQYPLILLINSKKPRKYMFSSGTENNTVSHIQTLTHFIWKK